MKAFIISKCEYILVLFVKLIVCSIVISVSGYNNSSLVHAIHWDHSVDLNDDYRVLWNIFGQEITFEVQVRTLGYVGLGFSHDGRMPGSDIAIGWVSQGQVHFQVSSILLYFLVIYFYCSRFFFSSHFHRHFASLFLVFIVILFLPESVV